MATWFDDFLVEREPRRWKAPDGMPVAIKAGQVFLQEADYGLEVAAAEAAKRPTTSDVRKAWKVRHGGRPSPVLLAVGYPVEGGTAIAICGPAGEEPPVHFDLEVARVERLADTALSEPSRHAAQRMLLRMLPELESDMPGLLNSGLLASQELRRGVPLRSDWPTATKSGQLALKTRGRSLIEALGFSVEDVVERWNRFADPANLAPVVPAVMRRAAQTVRDHAMGVEIEAIDQAVEALEAPYAERILRLFRRAMTIESSGERADVILGLVDELGLEPPPPPEPLPEINPEDVHLVCWLALMPGTTAVETAN